MNATTGLPVTIRAAYPDDDPALWKLAALDSSRVPSAPLLVAEVEGELRVAVSARDLRAIADPFVPTAHIVEMLRDHIARSQAEARLRRRSITSAPLLGLRTA